MEELMDWNAIYPRPEEPTPEQLSAYVSDHYGTS